MPEPTGTKAEAAAKPASLAYAYGDALYLNITPRCPTACEFCIKFSWDWLYRGNNLKLKGEPSVNDIVAAAGDPSQYSEIVFCGYGESTYRLDAMAEISRRLRAKGAKKMRLNTIGLGSLIQGRDIAPDLARIVDSVMISLNTPDPEEWERIHRPLPEYRGKGFEAAKAFVRACARQIPETYVTAVERPGADLSRMEGLVRELGAKMRWRPYLDEYESS